MPWWVAVISAAAVALSATVTTLWLLSIARRDASLRLEAIKDGLTVGAGTGGAAALLLAMRRQWLSERTQAHAEDLAHVTQAHAEEVARDTAYDATQRRVTELYARAVEQLTGKLSLMSSVPIFECPSIQLRWHLSVADSRLSAKSLAT
ncbi:hypothetical protein [Actinoallomurus iriomotensis]|nr:hypothetical protein [Actinoallomurus iriomotensis]